MLDLRGRIMYHNVLIIFAYPITREVAVFRPTSTQSSLFEADHYFPGILSKDDWSFTFKERVLPLIDEEKFRHLYSETEGRPNASIRFFYSLCLLCLCAFAALCLPE